MSLLHRMCLGLMMNILNVHINLLFVRRMWICNLRNYSILVFSNLFFRTFLCVAAFVCGFHFFL
jgi:hypothetical protein